MPSHDLKVINMKDDNRHFVLGVGGVLEPTGAVCNHKTRPPDPSQVHTCTLWRGSIPPWLVSGSNKLGRMLTPCVLDAAVESSQPVRWPVKSGMLALFRQLLSLSCRHLALQNPDQSGGILRLKSAGSSVLATTVSLSV